MRVHADNRFATTAFFLERKLVKPAICTSPYIHIHLLIKKEDLVKGYYNE